MADATDELSRFAERMGITNAAAEELVRRLRELNNAASSGANAFDVTRQATQSLGSVQQSTSQAVGQLGSSAYQAAKGLTGLPEQIAASASAINSITPLVTAITGISGQVAQVAGTATGAAIGSAFSPLGTLIGGMIGKKIGEGTAEIINATGGIINFFLRESQKVIDSFTQLSSVGATFGGSLEGLKNLSGQVGLSFETLAKIAVDNAQNLAMLGGGTQGALKLVTNTSNNLGNTLLALYGGFSNLNSEVADYMAARRRQGVSEMATDAQLVKQTGDYLYMMKELSALTGKSAKIVRSEIEQRTKNAATQLALDEMTETERTNFEYQLGQLPEALRGVYTDLVVAQKTGNTAVLTEGLKMGATMPGIYNKLENMVSALSMSPEEMKKRFGQEASGLVEETKNYRKEFKDQLYLFSAGRISSDVVRNIDTVLTNLGENLGRLKTLPDDIRVFGEQTTLLKNNAKGFTNEVGLITKEQEKIRVALNNLATDAGRFDFTLQLTSTVLKMTEKIIDGINELLPNLIKNSTETVRGPARMQGKIVETERALSGQVKTMADIDKEMEKEGKTQDELNYLKEIKEETQLQIKTFEDQLKRLKEEQQEINKQKQEKEEKRSSTTGEVTGESAAAAGTVSNTLGTTDNPLAINWKALSDTLVPHMETQTASMGELRIAIEGQGAAIRRLANSIA